MHAYLAGIVDGEGTITIAAPRNKVDGKRELHHIELTVSSTDLELLDWIKVWWGGTVSTKKVYQDHHRPSFAWRLTNRQALTVLIDIFPFLQVRRKRNRAALLITEWEALTPRNGKYTDEMLAKKDDLVRRFFEI